MLVSLQGLVPASSTTGRTHRGCAAVKPLHRHRRRASRPRGCLVRWESTCEGGWPGREALPAQPATRQAQHSMMPVLTARAKGLSLRSAGMQPQRERIGEAHTRCRKSRRCAAAAPAPAHADDARLQPTPWQTPLRARCRTPKSRSRRFAPSPHSRALVPTLGSSARRRGPVSLVLECFAAHSASFTTTTTSPQA
jgi:hypothetical protein